MKQLAIILSAAALATLPFHASAEDPACEWTMVTNKAGAILNTGTADSAGNLSLAAGAEMSEDVQVGNSGGFALRFPAENPTAAAESASTFDPLAGAEKFTVMAWVRRESGSELVNQSARIFSDIDTRGNVASGVEFRFSGEDGNLTLRINGTEVQTSYGIEPDNWSWHHVAVVYDGTLASTGPKKVKNAWFYIDGVQRGVGNNMEGLVVEANDVPVAIGNSAAGRVAGNLMVGSIDDVFVFRDWAPSPSGNGNLNLDIRDWMLVDDMDRVPPPEEEPEPPEPDYGPHTVPPVVVEDVVAQKIGTERNYEDLREGLIFINADDGELWFANEANPHGRAVCLFKGFPNWHSFTNTVRLNGNKLELNHYYSLMAESHALSARYGTQTVWTVVGEAGGDLAGMTVSLADESTLMISCNAIDGILQCSTNLTEANPWHTATNVEVVAQTDVAITWRVHLMMDQTGVEVYRVLNNGPSVAEGFHVYPEMHPHGGIEMGGVLATNWGDVTNGVNARIAAHESATNPHGITAAGIGALTAETDAAALEALGTHEADTNNPHAVTAEQAGAVPATWNNGWEIDTQTNGLSVKGGDWEAMRVYTNENGSTHATFGYHASTAVVGFDARTVDIGTDADIVSIGAAALKLDIGKGFNSTNFHIYKNPKFPDGLTSSNVVAGSVTAGSLTVGEGTCTNLAELASTGSVFAVSGRVSAIEGDYVKAADIADFATTQDVASVERRVERLEYPDWCTLYWGTNVLNGNNLTLEIPTNFPTKNLRIYIIDTYASAVDLVVQTNWIPRGDCMIEIYATSASAQTNRDIRLKIAGTQIERLTSQTARRRWVLCYDSTLGYWHARQEGFGFYNYIYPPSGYQAWTFPPTAPKTVEEWLSMQSRQGASP